MSTTPPDPSEGGPPPAGPPPSPTPPPPAGPWASDNLPPHPGVPVPAEVVRPSSITAAVRLMWVGAGLSAVGIVLGFADTDAIREEIERQEPSLTASEVDTAVTVGLAFGVVIGVVAVGLWLWMASANGKGKSWARVVATVFGGLNLVSSVFSLAVNPVTALSAVTTVISLVLSATILVLLYRPESSRYYEACSRSW